MDSDGEQARSLKSQPETEGDVKGEWGGSFDL